MSAAAAALLGLIFLAAGAGKLRDARPLVGALAVVAPRLAPLLRMVVPAAELALGALLLSGAAPRAAAVAALVALAALSGGLVVLRRRAPHVDCGCFGPGDEGSVWRNGALAGLALVSALWPAAPWREGATEAVGQATVVAGALCAWAVGRAFLMFARRAA